jgi:hypothetical protein
MRVVEAPNHAHIGKKDVSVFIAGGITNCPDWQSEFIDFCKTSRLGENVVLLNPRRANFDTSVTSDTVTQIEWEYDALERADIVVVWFPWETVCPITLFEVGREWTRREPDEVIVGCHVDYSKKLDLIVQGRFDFHRVSIGFECFLKRAIDKIRKESHYKLGIELF